MRGTYFRLSLELAAGTHLSFDYFDGTSVFAQSDIDCISFVRLPRGFENYDKERCQRTVTKVQETTIL